MRSISLGFWNAIFYFLVFFMAVPICHAVLPPFNYRLALCSFLFTLIAAAIAFTWSRKLWVTTIPAGIAFIVALTFFAHAMYLTDTGGTGNYSMYETFRSIKPLEVFAAICAIIAALFGSVLVRFWMKDTRVDSQRTIGRYALILSMIGSLGFVIFSFLHS